MDSEDKGKKVTQVNMQQCGECGGPGIPMGGTAILQFHRPDCDQLKALASADEPPALMVVDESEAMALSLVSAAQGALRLIMERHTARAIAGKIPEKIIAVGHMDFSALTPKPENCKDAPEKMAAVEEYAKKRNKPKPTTRAADDPAIKKLLCGSLHDTDPRFL